VTHEEIDAMKPGPEMDAAVSLALGRRGVAPSEIPKFSTDDDVASKAVGRALRSLGVVEIFMWPDGSAAVKIKDGKRDVPGLSAKGETFAVAMCRCLLKARS
jgi:hypothetical protein